MHSSSEFSLRVHHRNKKGRLDRVTPWRLHITARQGRLFEQPVDSLNLFSESGNRWGRLKYVENEVGGGKRKEFIPGGEHIAYLDPPTRAEIQLQEMANKDQTIEAQMAKLKALEDKLDLSEDRVKSAESRAILLEKDNKNPVQVKAKGKHNG